MVGTRSVPPYATNCGSDGFELSNTFHLSAIGKYRERKFRTLRA
jgi:hypothetical protein